MSEIRITPMEPGHFGVQVREGDVTSSTRLHVTEGFIDDLALLDVDHEVLVRETIGFLLDREPATSFPDEFTIDSVLQRFPEFADELRDRLA